MRIRLFSAVLALAMLIFATGRPGEAAPAATDAFTVRDVAVDVTAETAAAAREAALADGHVMAMARLLDRVLMQADRARVRPLGADEVIGLVQDFEVADERTSDVRYLARLTFRFKPHAVREFLRAGGLAHAETLSKAVVVVPVFGPRGDARLWEETNAWRQAWALRRSRDGLVPLVVPLGDLGDIAAITAEQALSGDQAALGKLARRYGSDDVVITQAVLLGDADAGQAAVQVGTSRLGTQIQATVIETYAQRPGESATDLLARVADAVDQQIQEGWKQSNLLHPGSQRVILVSVPLEDHRDWLEIKRRLTNVASIQRSEVASISRQRSELRLTFVGEVDQLALAMAQSDLSLAHAPVSGWELRVAGAGAEALGRDGTAPAVTPATGAPDGE